MKFLMTKLVQSRKKSPSMRREWIEIPDRYIIINLVNVSLHAEGVD